MFSTNKTISDELGGFKQRGSFDWFKDLNNKYFSPQGLKTLWNGDVSQRVQIFDDSELNEIANKIKSNKTLGQSIEALKEEYKDGRAWVLEYARNTDEARVSVDGLRNANLQAAQAQQTLTGTIKAGGLKSALGGIAKNIGAIAGNMLLFTAVSAGISLAIKKIDELVHADEIAIEEAQKLQTAHQDALKGIQDSIDTVTSSEDRFKELSKGVSDYGENISLTTDEYKEYQSIVQKILDINPTLIAGYDAEGNAIANKNTLIAESIRLLKEKQRQELLSQTTDENNWTMAKGAYSGYKDAKQDMIKASQSVSQELSKLLIVGLTDEYGNMFDKVDYNFVDRFVEKFGLSKENAVYSNSAREMFSSILGDANNSQKLAQTFSKDLTSLYEFLEKDTDLTNLNKELKEYDVAATKADQATKGFNYQLSQVAQSNDAYEKLTEAQQNFLNSYINGFKIDGDQLKSQDFVEDLTNQVYNFVDAIRENPVTQIYIQDLVDLQAKQENLPIDEYIKQYKEAINKIVDSIPNLTQKQKLDITTQLNVNVEEDKKLKDKIKNKLEQSGFSSKQINKLLANLSISDLRIAFSILSDPKSKYSSIEELTNAVNNAKKELEAQPVTITFGSTIEELDKVKSSFDVLDKAYANFIDKDKNFGFEDLSNIYEQFKEVKGVEKYLRQLQEAKGDAKKVKAAFSGLTGAYLQHSGILDTVTKKNSDLVTSMLKEMGVANASEIVNQALANSTAKVSAEKFIAENASFDLANATAAEIQELINEGKVTQDTAEYLAQLALQKQITNQNVIDTSGDIQNLIDLANAAGLAAVQIAKAKALQAESNYFSRAGAQGPKSFEYSQYEKGRLTASDIFDIDSINKEISKINNTTIPKINYTGGNATNKAIKNNAKKDKKNKGSTSEEQIKTIDWAENSINNLTKAYSRLEAELESINSTYGNTDKKLKQQISKYDELIKASRNLEKAYDSEADAYLKAFNRVSKKIPSKYVKKIKSGSTFSTEDFTVKEKNSKTKDKTYENVKKAQEYYQNYLDATNKKLEQKNKSKKLIDDQIQAKIDSMSNKISYYESKIDNALNYKDRIKANNQLAKSKEKQLNLEKALAKTSAERAKIDQEIKKNERERKENNVQYKTEHLSTRIEANEVLAENAIYYENQIKYSDKILKLQLERIKAEKSIAKTAAERVKLEEEEKKLITENALKRLDIIKQRYDNSSSLNSTKRDLYKGEISNIEAQGYQVGSKLYERIIGLAEFNAERLKREHKELIKQFEHDVAYGEIDVGTSKWYEALQKINDVNKAIQDGQSEIIEYNNALRQLSWDRFDLLLSQFEKMNEESNFLIELMSNKKLVNEVPDVVIKADDLNGAGGLTDYGNATNALHLQNYNTYMAQSDKLNEEITKLNKQIAQDGELADQNLINRRNELLTQQQEAILNAQSEKDAIIDLVTQGYEAQIEAMQKLTDLNKELLDKEQEREEYEKSIKDKSKSITTLQKQIAALSLSTDRKDIAERLKLQEELVNQQEELDQTQKEHSIETQKESLDKAMELYEQKIKEYLKNTDQVFTDTMNNVNSTSNNVMNTITSEAKKVGISISDNMIKIWSNTTPITEYGSTLWETINGESGVLSAISSITEAWEQATKAYEKYAKETAQQSVDSRDEVENTQYGNLPDVNEILGSDTGNYKPTGSTQLNKYVTGLGYKKLSWDDMAKLGQSLGITGIKSSSDVDMSKEKNAQNRENILNQLKYLEIRKVIGKPNQEKVSSDSTYYKKLSSVNQYLVSNGYKSLSAQGIVQLSKALGMTGVTTDNFKNYSDKMLKQLKSAGFSKGGFVNNINHIIKSNGDDGIATVQRKELILTAEQAKRFVNFFKTPTMSETVEKSLKELNNSARNSRASTLQITSPLIQIDGDVSTQQMFDHLQKQIDDVPNTLVRLMNNARTW